MKLFVGALAGLAAMVSLTPVATAAVTKPDAVAQEMIKGSPSDTQLRNADDAKLAGLAARCGNLDGAIYCLHVGWEDAPLSKEELAARVQNTAPEPGDEPGEAPFATQLRQWAAQPQEDRIFAEQAEMKEALAQLGKVKYFQYTANDEPLPADFFQKYPEVAEWANTDPAAAVTPTTSSTISASRTMKQPNGYYCGPTTMAIMAWNDPTGDKGHTPSVWAGRLGTTRSGTSIGAMVRVTNSYLTWDNRVGAYVTLGIAGYTTAKFRALFVKHTGVKKAPIILHPRWTANLNPFGRTTAGHFDVGAGYDFRTGHDTILIAEPAWPGTPNMFSTSTANVLQAQKNNSNFKNIGV
ncbi:hypothetical protein ABZX92_23605 [Lentzea sp. NPDC006480]|uniref:hypothetical protein n=1 Tax=Lentzea sp. NPDC006480 TaxID=3157176 RepID=UPI0033B57511